MAEEDVSQSLKSRLASIRAESTEEPNLKDRIAAVRQENPETPEPKTFTMNPIGDALRSRDVERSFQQGFFFGFSDEIEAAGKAIWDRLPGEDFVDAYVRNRDRIRKSMESFSEEHPVASVATEVLGGLGTAGAATGTVVSAGKTLLARMGRGAASGGAAGAVFGAGKADELSDVPGDMAKGGAFGAVVGGAVPPVFEGVGSAFSSVQSALRPSVGASRRLGQAMQRDDMTPEQILGALDEAKNLGKPAIIADVGGPALRRELETAVQRPGPATKMAEDVFATRNKEQLTRISSDLVKGTGVAADNVEDVIAKTMHTRSKAARPVYEKAMDFSAELNDEIVGAWNKAIVTPLGKQAKNHARKILNVENFDEAPLMERVDAFKRGLDKIIKDEKGSAIGAKAQEMKTNLVGLVDEVNPLYKRARQIWENESNYLDAIDRGREVLKPSFTAAKLKQEYAHLGDAEQEAFRIGVVDAVVTRMRQQSAKEPNLVKIIRAPEIRDKLKAVMKPDAAAKLDKILDIEDAMFATGNQVTKGSQTAQRTAAMAEQEKQLSALRGLDALLELVISPLRTVFTRAIPAIPRMTRERMLIRQNQEIARRLLISDTDEIFKIPALREPLHLEGVAIPPAIIAAEK